MYSMVITVNNIVYLKFAKRVDLKFSHQTHKKWLLCEIMDVLTNLIVVIILQYICIRKKKREWETQYFSLSFST